ncbi:MAG TPA: radical SAM protein, partial [Candidatus Omnitrophota bacterium]|nr:radical SAM protein [Candidatus Omnitrophota bacterium]
FPAYDLIDLPAYWKYPSFSSIIKKRYASLFSSRGCPYNCVYCHRIFGQKFRFHSAGRIIEEIEYLQKFYNVNDIEFLDDIFNLNHTRIFEFCDLLKKKGMRLKLSFPNGVRTDILTEHELRALRDAGLYFCSFALESGSPRIQKLIGRNLDIEKFLENVELAVSRGIFCNGYSMLGFPTETEAEMKQTIDVVCRSRLHTASFFTVTPFPNTEVYRHVMRATPEKLSDIRYDDMEYATIRCNISTVPDDVLFACQRQAHSRFYLDPHRVCRILKDYPAPGTLPFMVPLLWIRLTKGLFMAQSA